jgi:hypothetical protein
LDLEIAARDWGALVASRRGENPIEPLRRFFLSRNWWWKLLSGNEFQIK